MTRVLRPAALLLACGLLFLVLAGAMAQGDGPLLIVPRRRDPNQKVRFRFQQANIDDVLRFLADATGKLVYKDPAVVTSVTIRAEEDLTVPEAIRLVQTVLDLKGFALIETPEALIVTTRANVNTQPTKVTVGRDPAAIPQGKEIITHIFPLVGADATRLRDELQPLVTGSGTVLIANADTNSLVVVAQADNVRRLAQIIALLDKDQSDEIQVEVIRLKFADAAEVARYMTELFRVDTPGQPGTPGAFPFPFPGAGGGTPGGGGGAGAATPRGGLAQLRGRVRFAADERSNALIVYASPANIAKIKEIINQIDVNLAPRTEYRIVELQFADAIALADQINQLLDPAATPGRPQPLFGGFFGGGNQQNRQAGLQEFRVVPDVRTNSLIVTAPIDGMEDLVRLIRQLDKPSQVTSVVRVFQLQNAIASEVANTLRQLFQGTTQGGGLGFGLFGGGGRAQLPPGSPLDLLRQVTIVPNDQTNQLVISGPSQTFPVIEELLSTSVGLDRKLPQVFIEVIIADITLDDETKFGIEWTAVAGSSSIGTNFGLTSPTADPTGFSYSIVSRNFQATLRALKQQNRVKVISTPHVLVTDNSPALITIGESIPYAGSTTITSGVAQTSTEFQDVAITLNVTPRISPGSTILMDIDQVVNSLIEFIQIAPGQLAPRTTNRRAGTTVVVENDQTVVLGGIISDNERRSVQKVPILGDIPLIGNLFRNTTKTKSRTELVVFLTPHIVAETGQAGDNEALREYERQRLRVDPLKILDAPFRKPLELTPDALRRQRRMEPRTEGARRP